MRTPPLHLQLSGDEARLFSSHVYRTPVRTELRDMWSVDPLRLCYDSYYPRGKGLVQYSSNCEVESVVDVVFTTKEICRTDELEITMWVRGSQTSLSRYSLRVGQLTLKSPERTSLDIREAASLLLRQSLHNLQEYSCAVRALDRA